SRPRLLVGLQDASVVSAGEVAAAAVAVNDRGDAGGGDAGEGVGGGATGGLAPRFPRARIPVPGPPPTPPRAAPAPGRRAAPARGDLAVEAAPKAATAVGDVVIPLEPGQGRTLVLGWSDVELGNQENFVHFHCPAPGEELGAGLTNV